MDKFNKNYEIVDPEPDVKNKMCSSFEGFEKFGLSKINPVNFYTTKKFSDSMESLFTFQPRPADVFVCSYLKVGSTWLQEVTWAITNNKNNDHPLKNKDAYHKAPFFEVGAVLNHEDIPQVFLEHKHLSVFEAFNLFPDPRVFKSHLYFDFLHPEVLENNKLVYVVRDPRDACLSYYKFAQGVVLYGYKHSLQQFTDDYIKGHVFSGSYIEHLRQWWKNRNRQNVYTIYYENIKKDAAGEIKKLAEFLGEDLTQQQIDNIVHYTSFAEMKKRDITMKEGEAKKEFLKGDAEGFYRKGEAGSAQNEMTKELRNKIAKYFRENLGDVKLPYNFSDES